MTSRDQTKAGANGAKAKQRSASEYKGRLKAIWCPGCGDFGVLSALLHSLAELNINTNELAIVSGIGCSSRMPGFIRCYGFHGVHGRALPTAAGVKFGNPRMTVVVVGGDGDGLSIGAGHFPHIARRNVDLTYLMLDNRTYALTKGQTSPTTPSGTRTKTSPQGVLEIPMDPVAFAVSFGASFVARGYSAQKNQLRELITKAIRHRGFSMVHILSPCVTFGRGSGYNFFNKHVTPLPEDHDSTDRGAAVEKGAYAERIYTGVFYRVERDEYIETLQKAGGTRGRELDETDPKIDTEALIQRFS
jgi:2-oxoglutarate ferredoxin oxidoreductase subunit beta